MPCRRLFLWRSPLRRLRPDVHTAAAVFASCAAGKTRIIEIELGGGKRVSVDENVDADALGRVLDVLSRR